MNEAPKDSGFRFSDRVSLSEWRPGYAVRMTAHSQCMPHLPGSRYAAELQKKGQDMRFPSELEQEYHMFYLAKRRSHVRFFNLIIALVAANRIVIFESESSALSTGVFKVR